MPNDKNLYLPVLVGATQNYREGIDYQRDDEGENISKKNPHYSELTAVYWAWKNLEDVDAVGLVHYRRYFMGSAGLNLSGVLKSEDVEDILNSYEAIVPKKRNYYIETNYSHFIHAHGSEALDMTRRIIQKAFPTYVQSFDSVIKKRSAHMFNMFIMKKEQFDKYCEWLFKILFQLEATLDVSNYTGQEKRIFGYISELLLDVWLQRNQIKFKEVKWRQFGKKHTLNKLSNFLLRKFSLGGKQTHF